MEREIVWTFANAKIRKKIKIWYVNVIYFFLVSIGESSTCGENYAERAVNRQPGDRPGTLRVDRRAISYSFIYNTRIRLASVPNAVGQATTAANYICGTKQPYNQVPWFWSDQYDTKLQSAGLAHDYDKTEINGDIRSKKFTVAYFKQGRMIALDAINSPKEFMAAKKIIASSV